jgi:predicted kinase
MTTQGHLFLLRGLPGSGKSTLAQVLAALPGSGVLSIDDYFTDENGVYTFRHLDNHKAYQDCIDRVRAAMTDHLTHIIVHNTFVYDWEMQPYLLLAEEFQYQLHVCTVEKYHTGTNVHEVSEEQISKMAEKYGVRLK